MIDKKYYQEMLKKDRLMPIIIGDRLMAFITFYITNDESKYTEADPWDVLDDNLSGNIFYIAQLLTDKKFENRKIFFNNWSAFKKNIKNNFPLVKIICWRRWDKENNILKIYKKEI